MVTNRINAKNNRNIIIITAEINDAMVVAVRAQTQHWSELTDSYRTPHAT